MTSEKTKKEKTPKPKYNMWQNSAWMISTAWKAKEKKVLVFCLLQILIDFALNILNLYTSPTVVGVIEAQESMRTLLLTVLFFAVANMFLSAAKSYINTNTLYGRVTLRTFILNLLTVKCSVTSYPNTESEDFIKKRSKANDALGSNADAGEAVWGTLVSLSVTVLSFAVYLMLMTNINPALIAVTVVLSLVGFFINRRLNEYEYNHRDEIADIDNKMWYIKNTSMDNKAAKDIRIFGLKPWLEELQQNFFNAKMTFHRKAESVYFWTHIINIVITFLRNGLAYLYLITMVLSGEITSAEFLLYFSAVGNFTSEITSVLNYFQRLHTQSLDLCSIRECLEYPELFKFEDGEKLVVEKNKKYEIKLENVSFRYPGAEKDTLKNINLTIRPGEKIAVVGLNGAGKTTLVKLICGFYDPTEGRVLLNGKDIRDFNRFDYYEMFSAVFQKFSLLAGSVAMNVAQTEDGIDMDRVKTCIAKAGLAEKIESLPEKYDTLLNRAVYEDSIELSGGETQRLMLARALYKDGPILILDEPTAALDPIAESQMYGKYNEMSDGKSSVYISHRLASTRFCDRVLYIENNVILEEGTHSELLRRGGRYAELFEIQSRYYREGAIEK